MPDTNLVHADPADEEVVFPINEVDCSAFLDKTELHNRLLSKLSESRFNLSLLLNSLEQAKKQVKKIEINVAVIKGRMQIIQEILDEDFNEECEDDENESDENSSIYISE
jgi:hypothetical protein